MHHRFTSLSLVSDMDVADRTDDLRPSTSPHFRGGDGVPYVAPVFFTVNATPGLPYKSVSVDKSCVTSRDPLLVDASGGRVAVRIELPSSICGDNTGGVP